MSSSGTAINTNVSSLTNKDTLARANAIWQNSSTRLSTGLRANEGTDSQRDKIKEVVQSFRNTTYNIQGRLDAGTTGRNLNVSG